MHCVIAACSLVNMNHTSSFNCISVKYVLNVQYISIQATAHTVHRNSQYTSMHCTDEQTGQSNSTTATMKTSWCISAHIKHIKAS